MELELPDDSCRHDEPTLRLMAVGDIMMGTTFPDSINGSHLPAQDGKRLMDEVKDLFGQADIVCGNLEGTLLDGPGQRRQMRNPETYYIFRMPTGYARNLTDAGIDFVGIANNHINDFGHDGRRSTMQTLESVGVKYAGLKNRCEIAYIDHAGKKVAITQFGHGGNNLDVNDLKGLKRVVAEMRRNADWVIVTFHGGAEGSAMTHVPHAAETYVGERRGDVEAFAHAAIDAGADAVFGHGPHVPRAAELYKGHIIFYSLGNFCTPYRVNIQGVSGYAPVADITLNCKGKFIEGQIHSFIQQRGAGPRKDSQNRAARTIKRLSKEDFPKSKLEISPEGALSF